MYPPAYPHNDIEMLYPNVYLLHGSIRIGPMLRINRNMIVLKHHEDLILINPVRMNETGLGQLDTLGTVKYIFRLGDFHGLDDQFYLDRYRCEFWAQNGQDTYKSPKPTTSIATDTVSPFPNSEFFIFESAKYPEAALLIKDYRLLITTDSVQYHADWNYFTWLSKAAFKLIGFKNGINIGPPWLKRVTPEAGSMQIEFERLLSLDFDALIGAHGKLLLHGAREALKLEMNRIFK